MQRLNELLAKSREAQQSATKTVGQSQSAIRMRAFSKLIKDSHMPRYVLFGVIMLKSVSIYDKFKQLVAINQMNVSMIASKSQSFRDHFESEEELQDLMTKRMFEQTRLNSLDDDDLDLTEEEAENNLQGGMASVKVKTRQLK